MEAQANWEHLSQADLVEGEYDGIYNMNPETPGEDSPSSEYSNESGWHIYTVGTGTNNQGNGTAAYHGKRGRALSLGGVDDKNDWYFSGGFASAQDAMQIDTKLDDGQPSSGNVFILKGRQTAGHMSNCVDGLYNASYGSLSWDFSTEDRNCKMVFFY